MPKNPWNYTKKRRGKRRGGNHNSVNESNMNEANNPDPSPVSLPNHSNDSNMNEANNPDPPVSLPNESNDFNMYEANNLDPSPTRKRKHESLTTEEQIKKSRKDEPRIKQETSKPTLSTEVVKHSTSLLPAFGLHPEHKPIVKEEPTHEAPTMDEGEENDCEIIALVQPVKKTKTEINHETLNSNGEDFVVIGESYIEKELIELNSNQNTESSSPTVEVNEDIPTLPPLINVKKEPTEKPLCNTAPSSPTQVTDESNFTPEELAFHLILKSEKNNGLIESQSNSHNIMLPEDAVYSTNLWSKEEYAQLNARQQTFLDYDFSSDFERCNNLNLKYDFRQLICCNEICTMILKKYEMVKYKKKNANEVLETIPNCVQKIASVFKSKVHNKSLPEQLCVPPVTMQQKKERPNVAPVNNVLLTMQQKKERPNVEPVNNVLLTMQQTKKANCIASVNKALITTQQTKTQDSISPVVMQKTPEYMIPVHMRSNPLPSGSQSRIQQNNSLPQKETYISYPQSNNNYFANGKITNESAAKFLSNIFHGPKETKKIDFNEYRNRNKSNERKETVEVPELLWNIDFDKLNFLNQPSTSSQFSSSNNSTDHSSNLQPNNLHYSGSQSRTAACRNNNSSPSSSIRTNKEYPLNVGLQSPSTSYFNRIPTNLNVPRAPPETSLNPMTSQSIGNMKIPKALPIDPRINRRSLESPIQSPISPVIDMDVSNSPRQVEQSNLVQIPLISVQSPIPTESQRSQRSVSLVPKSLKDAIGRKSISSSSLYLIIIEWSVEWFPQYNQYKTYSDPIPPPIFPGVSLSQVRNTYRDVNEYYNTYLKLLLLECWFKMYNSWKETQRLKKVRAGKIISYDPKNEFNKYVVEYFVHKSEHELMPKESCLVLLTFTTIRKEGIIMLGYVTRVLNRPFFETDYSNEAFKSLKRSREDILKYKITIYTVFKSDDINNEELVLLEKLVNIRKILQQNDALSYIDKSPLKSVILSPMISPHKLSVTLPPSREGRSNVLDVLCDKVMNDYPLLARIIAPKSFKERMESISNFIEKLKYISSDSKIIITAKSEITLARIAHELRRHVIVYISLDKISELQQFSLKKLAENYESNHPRNNNDLFNSDKRKWAEKKVLSMCDVILVLLLGCHVSIATQTKELNIACCILEEAHNCTEPESVVPLTYGIKKYILFGEENYLCDVSCIATNYDYNKSLFNRASI